MKSDSGHQLRYIHIRDDIRKSIFDGTLKDGDRLPAVTDLAREKGVTAATVRRALQDLAGEGLVHSHVGRGTFVSRPEDKKNLPGNLLPKISRDMSALMAASHKEGTIAFTRGIGAPGTIEPGILTRLTEQTLSAGESIFHDYADSRGLPGLRQAIAELYQEQGIPVSSDSILVTSGSQQALSLLARQAAEMEAPVYCETPCYAGVINAFSAFSRTVYGIARSDSGIPEESLPAGQGSFLYVCPILHNPTGTNMSEERHAALSDWARITNSLVISDEVYRDIHPEGGLPPSCMVSPGLEHAAVLGSLSKSFISGLRVGWVISSPERIRDLTAIKKAMDLGCPPLMQGIAEAFLRDNEGFRAHRARIRVHYLSRRDCTLAALKKWMPAGVSWTEPAGGFQLQVRLPQGTSSIALLMLATDYGVSFLPGDTLELDGGSTMRLCYGSLDPVEIEEGIQRLSRAIEAYLNKQKNNTTGVIYGDV